MQVALGQLRNVVMTSSKVVARMECVCTYMGACAGSAGEVVWRLQICLQFDIGTVVQ